MKLFYILNIYTRIMKQQDVSVFFFMVLIA